MLTVKEMRAMTDDEIRCLKRREWVVVSTQQYYDGMIEVREGRPLLPRLRMKTDYRSVPRNGKARSFTNIADARRWIEEQEIGGNPNGLLHEIAGRRSKQGKPDFRGAHVQCVGQTVRKRLLKESGS